MRTGKVALIGGLLNILGRVAGILSIAPSVDGPEYLVAAAAGGTQVMRSAFFPLIMVAAYVASPLPCIGG